MSVFINSVSSFQNFRHLFAFCNPYILKFSRISIRNLEIHTAWTLFNTCLPFFPHFLLAVPKKKVSHSRKATRSSGKGLKDKTSSVYLSYLWNNFTHYNADIVSCPACGTPKLAHHLCSICYSALSRDYKRAQRDTK